MSENKTPTEDVNGVGKTLIKTLESPLSGSPSGFRTRMLVEPGREVMLRTKGGNPEVTERVEEKQSGCVKGPLTEIAFAYNVTTSPVGYRRWYGEPDPATGTPAAVTQYEWSSDGLLCLASRKLQKICFLDANGQKADFLFAAKPENRDASAESLPAVSASAAGSTARFKFTEGKYTEREWYQPSESSNIGWAFTNPASSVRFFIRRLRSIMFTVSDVTKKVATKKIKWIFAGHGYTDRTAGSMATCANQNARELSFVNRSFFPVVTDGNMDKLTMSVGIDEPPAIVGGPSFVLNFKKPGSFTSAIDPAQATGKARPSSVDDAIDLCEFSSFGNPFHGLVWFAGTTGTPTQTFYTDVSMTDDWGFAPAAINGLSYGFSGANNDFKYFNIGGKNPELAENKVTTGSADDGVMRRDATLINGAWYVVTPDTAYWGQLDYDEFLYKDGNGVVWVVKCNTSLVAPGPGGRSINGLHLTVTLRRRYGVLGTNFNSSSSSINRVLFDGDITLPDATYNYVYVGIGQVYPAIYANGEQQPDGKAVMLKFHSTVEVACYNDHRYAGSLGCYLISFSGNGAVVSSVDPVVAIGDGISASVSEKYAHLDGNLWLLDSVWRRDELRWEPLRVQYLSSSSSVSGPPTPTPVYGVPSQYNVERVDVLQKGYRVFLGGILVSGVVITRTSVFDELWDWNGTAGFFNSATVETTYDNPSGYGTESPARLAFQRFLPNNMTGTNYTADERFNSISVNSPKAFAIFIQNWKHENGTPPAMTQLVTPESSAPGVLFYKERSINVPSNELSYYKPSATLYYSQIGFAYDYHSRTLIAVPFDNSAYFV